MKEKFLVILLFLIIITCKNTNQKTSIEVEKITEPSYSATIFPQDTTKLWITPSLKRRYSIMTAFPIPLLPSLTASIL